MNTKDFRAELVKIMPGYDWTVQRPVSAVGLRATGKQSSGFNRTSTLVVERFEVGASVEYRVKSAGFGAKARWLGYHTDTTLARALRGLQQQYQSVWAEDGASSLLVAGGDEEHMNRAALIPGENSTFGKAGAVYHLLFDWEKNGLEFAADYPVSAEFLPDTTPNGGQWKRTRHYFGQALHGTNFPDRWLLRRG